MFLGAKLDKNIHTTKFFCEKLIALYKLLTLIYKR